MKWECGSGSGWSLGGAEAWAGSCRGEEVEWEGWRAEAHGGKMPEV